MNQLTKNSQTQKQLNKKSVVLLSDALASYFSSLKQVNCRNRALILEEILHVIMFTYYVSGLIFNTFSQINQNKVTKKDGGV